MQRYKITHQTYYNYTEEVTLGPHSLRLRPRESHELRVESLNVNITPPAELHWHRDAEGNSVAIATFRSPTQHLAVESELIIQQYNEQPLDFIVSDHAVNYPFAYNDDDKVLLSPYLALASIEMVNLIKNWVFTFWDPDEQIQTYALLNRLAENIFKTFVYTIREEPGVQSADYTLSCKSGSCRDFALLFMEATRSLGLASRFVSGYLHAPQMANEIGATHAWAEVYLPGAGWIGFDPTIGKIAGADHIAVAVARLAESVPPIGGTFAGNADSSLDVGVWVAEF